MFSLHNQRSKTGDFWGFLYSLNNFVRFFIKVQLNFYLNINSYKISLNMSLYLLDHYIVVCDAIVFEVDSLVMTQEE